MSTDLESSVESLDHPVDNAPVRTLQHKGLTIEGYSRAAVQTYWRIPEMKLGFDLGAQPWSFMSTPNWFVSHVHLDHIGSAHSSVANGGDCAQPKFDIKDAPSSNTEKIVVAKKAKFFVGGEMNSWFGTRIPAAE